MVNSQQTYRRGNMDAATHIHIDDSDAAQGERRATISGPSGEARTITYRSYDGPLSPGAGADPFVLGSLLHVMKIGAPVQVHGPVSRRLLRNVEELQSIWAKWKPDIYNRVDITADTVTGDVHVSGVVSAFSGGVDASFTVLRHLEGTGTRDALTATLFVHGLDIPADDEPTFRRARERGEKMLAGTGIRSLGVYTDVRNLGQVWEDVHGLALASCLALYQDTYGVGLIGSSEAYDELVIPWGSSPITDHLFSTGSMAVRHDGAGYSRTDKVAALARWQPALNYLRVCWAGKEKDRNCGRCEKCIRTYLNFRAVGVDTVPFLDHQPTPSEIRGMVTLAKIPLNELNSLAAYARRQGMQGEWVRALRFTVAKNRAIFPVIAYAVPRVLGNDRLRGIAKAVIRRGR